MPRWRASFYGETLTRGAVARHGFLFGCDRAMVDVKVSTQLHRALTVVPGSAVVVLVGAWDV